MWWSSKCVFHCFSNLATNNLQALNQSYKSHEDHILFGRLSACARLDEELSENLRYRLVTPIDGLIVQEPTGDFEYT